VLNASKVYNFDKYYLKVQVKCMRFVKQAARIYPDIPSVLVTYTSYGNLLILSRI